MTFHLGKFQIQLRRPVVLIGPNSGELTYRLGRVGKPLPVRIPRGYRRKPYGIQQNGAMLYLLKQCGFPFSFGGLREALALCIPDGVHLIEHAKTGRLVAMMMSRHLSISPFPFGGRIDWLATAPAHRGRGLGLAAASLATNQLLRRGYQNIWVTTQPSRRAAIRIFISMGFVPVSGPFPPPTPRKKTGIRNFRN